MKRLLVVGVALTSALTACSGDNGNDSVGQSSPTPSATTAAPGECAPSGTGTTDLTKKPAWTLSKAPAPAETTITEVVCGSGPEAKEGSRVAVKYVGLLYADGKEFDSSWSRSSTDTLPFTIGSGVIPGFSKGTAGMRVGGRREVVIPSKDGYGPGGSGPIPPNATLVFLIDLVSVS